jgi:hypothetical protein
VLPWEQRMERFDSPVTDKVMGAVFALLGLLVLFS